ncbi:hypothetical protein EZS27_004098 [termite gut metagenome]|uniref:Uncharacterized protein n=1 Tax=termite gut metagenome TaxID=433724 RepID=A0A5J4SRE2_9ZZZZ
MDDNKRLLHELTLEEAIFRCGALRIPHEEVVLLIREKCHIDNENEWVKRLKTPGTPEYDWYQKGMAEGTLKLNIDLESNVSNPKAKDAYKHLSAERRRQAINRKLNELFGLE